MMQKKEGVSGEEALLLSIRKRSKVNCQLRINDNFSTLISVKREPGVLIASVHRMFLDASQDIREALAQHIVARKGSMSPALKKYMNDHYQRLDYRERLSSDRLEVQGVFWGLQEIYDSLNRDYFQGELDLAVTWYGKAGLRPQKRVTFGLYCEPFRLIKMHRLLDNADTPKHVIAFIMYHEMLHHVHPPYVDEQGRTHIHNKEFKFREKAFQHYEEATHWLQSNWGRFFHAA